MKAPQPSEIQIQQAFRNRLYYSAPEIRVVAIPNASRRTQWEVIRAKKEGLAPGFPDCLCLAPGGLIAFIEFKSSKGRVSEAQAEWGERLTESGFHYAVCRSADAAVEFLRSRGFQIRERAA